MRKQTCLYFGGKQTEIKLLKHAIVYEHVLGLLQWLKLPSQKFKGGNQNS